MLSILTEEPLLIRNSGQLAFQKRIGTHLRKSYNLSIVWVMERSVVDIISLTPQHLEAFEKALQAMAEFKHLFGRPLDEAVVAEIYVAKSLGLGMSHKINEQGYDLISPRGERYQVKYRGARTRNVEVNNFDFDYLVLVNLDEDYRLMGMWCLPVEEARRIFAFRSKFRKYQCAQEKVKAHAKRIQ